MRIALAQLDLSVGDIDGNLGRCLAAAASAAEVGADLVVLPELALTGYPPEDLLARPDFVDRAEAALSRFTAEAAAPAIIGCVRRSAGGLANSAVLVSGGAVVAAYDKRLLPNYSVYDEERYFVPGPGDAVVPFGGTALALTVCEDIWDPATTHRLAGAGARLVANISASPFHSGKGTGRERMLVEQASGHGLWIAYCNLVGGQDELVFDGRSVLIAPDGTVVARGASFAEDLVIAEIDLGAGTGAGPLAPMSAAPEEHYRALELGLRDYVRKNGFTDVVLGLSGGIDSALVATIAADALGPARVHGVLMPGVYSSEGSVTDARVLASNLGIATLELPISEAHDAMRETLAAACGCELTGLTDENLQARIRGMLLMALSNAHGWLVLTTGNKSEFAVGYSTLYGDMAGGFAPIKDVFKTRVYELARWRNGLGPAIPRASLGKAPSAELRPDQTDEDTLPPYDVLDAILSGYVERDRSVADLVADGFDAAIVERVVRMVDAAEYKRRQGPPGTRITPKAFGRDRRMPITNRYRA